MATLPLPYSTSATTTAGRSKKERKKRYYYSTSWYQSARGSCNGLCFRRLAPGDHHKYIRVDTTERRKTPIISNLQQPQHIVSGAVRGRAHRHFLVLTATVPVHEAGHAKSTSGDVPYALPKTSAYVVYPSHDAISVLFSCLRAARPGHAEGLCKACPKS